MAAVIHVIKSVGGEVGWKRRKRGRKLGGKAGLSTRSDNGDPQETAEEDFPRCCTGVMALKLTNTQTYYFTSYPPPCLIPHRLGHPCPHEYYVIPISMWAAKKQASCQPSINVLRWSVSRFSLSLSLVAPAPIGASCQLTSLACHWLADLTSEANVGQ